MILTFGALIPLVDETMTLICCRDTDVLSRCAADSFRNGYAHNAIMATPQLIAGILTMSVMLLAAGEAPGQNFPARTVRIVTSEPGSSSDFIARLIAQGITGSLGRPVIVENRGGGMLAGDVVLRAAPDGHTLLLNGSSLWLAPFMRENVAYDPVRDYVPVTLAASAPNILVVHPSLPVDSVKALVALARARPGELNYGSGSTGAPSHLSAELFKALANVNILRIPYKGSGPTINALMAGQVQLMFISPTSVAPLVKSGKLRALAVSAAQPSPLAPGLPTIAAAGLPGYESASTFGILAPANTPPAIITRLNREMTQSLSKADAKERLFLAGVEGVAGTSDEFAAAMKSDMAKWGKLIRDAGIRGE